VTEVHGLLGRLAIVLTLVAGGWAIGLAAARRVPGRLFVGNLVWVVLAVAAAALTGAAVLLSSGPPADALHLLYGLLALALLPAAALVSAARPARQQAAAMAIACVVLAILLFRLVQTGG
jgi:hypothetical protein